MTTWSAGDFWLADIPFTDGTGSKVRPALVLWVENQDAVVVPVTTSAPRTVTDVPLKEWRAAGLRFPCLVRLTHLDTLELSRLLRRVGRIQPADAAEVKRVWANHVQPAF